MPPSSVCPFSSCNVDRFNRQLRYAYNKNYVGEVEASQLGPELAWVNRQQEAGLFDYTPTEKIADMMKSDPWGTFGPWFKD
jgi:hypothetical protein